MTEPCTHCISVTIKHRETGEHVGTIGFDVTPDEAKVLREVWERHGASTVVEGETITGNLIPRIIQITVEAPGA